MLTRGITQATLVLRLHQTKKTLYLSSPSTHIKRPDARCKKYIGLLRRWPFQRLIVNFFPEQFHHKYQDLAVGEIHLENVFYIIDCAHAMAATASADVELMNIQLR